MTKATTTNRFGAAVALWVYAPCRNRKGWRGVFTSIPAWLRISPSAPKAVYVFRHNCVPEKWKWRRRRQKYQK